MRHALLVLLLCVAGVASAHATLVRGALINEPVGPQPNTPVTLRMVLLDPNDVPIEDAVVSAEVTSRDRKGETVTVRFTETDEAGVYLGGPLVLPQAGRYWMLVRDQTYRQEEARAELNYQVGGENPKASYIFVLPPTTTGPGNLRAWLLWLVLLPIGAAVVVTAVVLLSPPQKKPEGLTQRVV